MQLSSSSLVLVEDGSSGCVYDSNTALSLVCGEQDSNQVKEVEVKLREAINEWK